MDVISHGVWGGIAFGRKSKQLFWFAFLFGVLPDVIVFSWRILAELSHLPSITNPELSVIPNYVLSLYNITHSLVIALLLFIILSALWKKKAIAFLAWPLHVLFDIFSHSTGFFPTPYLWPFATPFFDGIPWVTPWVFFMNWGVLIILLFVWRLSKKRK
jgi:hypothetical protein